MKLLNLKTSILSIFCFTMAISLSFAQQGNVTIHQDKNINTLLDVKKEMNKNETDTDRYKIQIYSGNNRYSAESSQRDFNTTFSDWKASIQYETPNFKIWSNSFNTRLEADKALKQIKAKFPAAFIFKPKK